MNRTRLDHIGILVANIDAAVARMTPLFGTPPVRKDLPEVGLRVAEFQAENITVELLQYTGRHDAMAKEVMGERLGLNHISLRVDDVAESVRSLSDQGFVPMKGFPREGAHGRVAFFEIDPSIGFLFEVCQPHAGA